MQKTRKFLTGFTLLELIIVVIIIGVLAGVAIPQYLNAAEKARAAKARANLVTLAQAEKIYHAEQSAYTTFLTELADKVEGIRGIDDSDSDWSYNFTATSTTFNITATRSSGANALKTITISDQGNFSGDHPFKI